MSDELGLSHSAALKLGLRDLLFRSTAGPAWVFAEEAIDVLRDLWWDVAQSVEATDRRPFEGLGMSPIRQLDGHWIRVIHFPPPERVAENHFAAVAYRPERGAFLFRKRIPESLRYLALEFGLSIPSGAVRTVLGEWTADGHLNYGDGPDPTVDDFLGAIRPILAHEATPVAGYRGPRAGG